MLNIKMYESKIQKRLEVNIRIENTYCTCQHCEESPQILLCLHHCSVHGIRMFSLCSAPVLLLSTTSSLLCSWCKNVLPVFSPRTAAIYYFITALFMLLACFDTYFALPLNVSTPGPKTALLEKFWQIQLYMTDDAKTKSSM